MVLQVTLLHIAGTTRQRKSAHSSHNCRLQKYRNSLLNPCSNPVLMVRLIRSAQRIIRGLQRHNHTPSVQSRNATSAFLFQSRPYTTDSMTKSHFEANIIRILRNEIDYQTEYAPPHQPVTKFNSFAVEDRPGEQFIVMNGKFGDIEDIKIKVSMFDGFMNVPKVGEDSTGEEVRLHISLIVDISKENCSDILELLCTAWPDSLEVQQIYLPSRDNKLARPYIGPNFRNLSDKLRRIFREYLEARGVNDELCVFLHEYVLNKDRIELIKWLGNVKSLVEK